ncbi:MAG: nuclear transport factor 2 family protein [Gammaproteobacteria bacterium]
MNAAVDTSERTRAAVEGFIALARVGRREEALAFLAPDVVVRQSPALPFGGEYRGHAGYRRLGERFAELFAERSGGAGTRLLVEGDTAVAIGEVQGRLHGGGERFRVQVLERYVVHAGLIVEITPFYFDPGFATSA